MVFRRNRNRTNKFKSYMIVKKVFNEYVIVKRDEASKERESGLQLLEVENPYSGVVMASFDEAEVAVGAHVVYQRQAGIPIEIDGQQLVVLRKVEIFCEL